LISFRISSVTDQFEQWWDTLSVEKQESIEAAVEPSSCPLAASTPP
jgi:hypothetical protein